MSSFVALNKVCVWEWGGPRGISEGLGNVQAPEGKSKGALGFQQLWVLVP